MNAYRNLNRIVFILCLGIFTACEPEPASYENYKDPLEELSGGEASVYDASPLAFSKPINGLENNDDLLFFVGNSFFRQNWVTAPASTTARDGLGPFFNARSCSGCHFEDGRGRPPHFDGEVNHGLLIRLGGSTIGLHGEPLGDVNYGGQLQDQAIVGVPQEGGFTISHTTITGQYATGESYTLQNPQYTLNFSGYGAYASGMFSPRIAPQMIGLGLLEALSESSILERSDPMDADADGISGKANRVWDRTAQAMRLGRFGWKANEPSLLQQSAGAFLGDMGITSYLFPIENCTSPQTGCQSAQNGGQHEIEEDDLHKVELYSSVLAVPTRRNHDAENVLRGKELFFLSGCESCHRSKMVTGTHPKVAALSNQTIFPYTDLLLHDMGDDLADGRPDFEATGSEWRTPPLWGIGLFQTVNNHTRYLHDGRAQNLTEAILWHGGEAEQSATKFKQLTSGQRQDLISFLESL